MNNQGPLIVIEENKENRLLFEQIFSEAELKNSIHFFNSFDEAKYFIFGENLKPFVFLSNVVHFTETGLKDPDNKYFFEKLRCPFLFFSILFPQCFLIDTFSTPKKSYFANPYSEEKFKNFVNSAVKYWQMKSFGKERKIKDGMII